MYVSIIRATVDWTGAAALSYAQVARLCSVSPRTVRSWVAAGDLPVVRLSGSTVRVLPSDLEAFLASKRRAPVEAAGA
jgi:excisionase family DNA binding protein